MKLLCPACEDVFNTYETEFSKVVFHPIHSKGVNNHTFNYEEWFHRFAVSVSWRCLLFLTKQDIDSPFPFSHGEHVNRALDIWRAYLNKERADVDSNVQHLIILDEVESSTGIENDFDLFLYIQRAIDFNTLHSENEAYIFTKLGKIVIAGVILNEDPRVQWNDTEINFLRGSYRAGNFAVSSLFFEFLKTGVQLLRESRPKMRKRQLARMDEAFFKRYGILPRR